MKYIIFFALIAFAGGWLYLWRYVWTGMASCRTAPADILKSLAGGLVIVLLMVGWSLLMAHGCEKQCAAMEKGGISKTEYGPCRIIIIKE